MSGHRLWAWAAALLLGYGALIGVGAAALRVEAAAPPGQRIPWDHAFFTAASALSLSGLAVRDTATQLSSLGQGVLAALVQAGILAVFLVYGVLLQRCRGVGTGRSLRRAAALSVGAAATVEAAGALALMALGQGAGVAAFHAVTAFGNTGFVLSSAGQGARVGGAAAHAVLLPLALLGGMGLPILLLARGVHTRVVLAGTALLYVVGTGLFLAERGAPALARAADLGVTANLSEKASWSTRRAGEALAEASVLSVGSRSAGYRGARPLTAHTPSGQAAALGLGWVGGAPGGTAGGVGLVAIAVLAGAALRAHDGARRRLGGRRMGEGALRVALALVALECLVAAGAALLLGLTEPFPFGKILFLAVSATANSGFDAGAAPALSGLGLGVLAGAMTLGRIGPAALLGTALIRGAPRRPRALLVLG